MFLGQLIECLKENAGNDHADNFQFSRFGAPERDIVQTHDAYERMFPYLQRLSDFYDLLADEESKHLLVQLTAFRLAGHRKIRLPLSAPSYWDACRNIELMADKTNAIDSGMAGWKLYFNDLSRIGLPLSLYTTTGGILYNFILKQYEYTVDDARTIRVERGDVVIDAGGCWGDTALSFAAIAGPEGRVLTFEFIPHNLAILHRNTALNPQLQQRITAVEHPVWDRSGVPMYYLDRGAGSHVSLEAIPGYTGVAASITIDDACAQHGIDHVDFIKMDIEGAEPRALAGAIETITRCRPKLALAIYHNFDDFAGIVHYVNGLHLGYTFYLNHYTIHHEETVLYCDPS